MDANEIKILICCHKPCELPKDGIFLPIQVGAAISDVDLGIQRDDQVNGQSCDNISAKNKSYCELTAIYWAWKNIKKLYPNLGYIGINHYRRYFAFGKKISMRDSYLYPESNCKTYHLDIKNMKRILAEGKTIIAKKKIYPYSLETDYCVCHYSDDLRTLKKIVKELYPEYEYTLINVLEHNNALAPYNMTVIRWSDFSNYCEWLFSILTEAEKRIDISNYTDAQKRIFGYMAERLFNIWLFHNKIKIKQIPINWYTNAPKTLFLSYYQKKTRCKKTFNTSLPLKIKIKHFLYLFPFGRNVINTIRQKRYLFFRLFE